LLKLPKSCKYLVDSIVQLIENLLMKLLRKFEFISSMESQERVFIADMKFVGNQQKKLIKNEMKKVTKNAYI